MAWLSSDEEQPDDAALRAEQAERVRSLLERLDPSYRAPLVLRYWHDLSYKEIASILNLTEPAVKTRLHRARLQMAALLEEQAPAVARPLPTRSPESAPSVRAAGALHVSAQTALAA
jgi:DNA-directed RNA polymerase specialized sigma24 family protein